MFKKFTVILVLIMLVFSTVPAYAAKVDVQENVIYKSEINVTEDGGVYQVGFATIKFPKDFTEFPKDSDGKALPITINVVISAVNGVPIIEFTPDIHDFNAEVVINVVHPYNGLLYDTALEKNIKVHIKHQTLLLEHFSRYAFS